MTSKIIVPVSDFAALITRLEKVENELTARKEREAKRYNHGPCLRCGYGPWESFRASPPKCCPRCHSAYWDQEPRYKGARTPEDPPNPKWTTAAKPGPRERARAQRRAVAADVLPEWPVVEAPKARPPVILPPELRPPGEPLIPPPPLPDVVAARTVDNPMNVRPLSEQLAERVTPVVHTAPLPDTIVERILATGDAATIDEIREAREEGDAISEYDRPASESVPEAERSTPPALQARKDAFFADAIAAGLVAPVVEGATDADPAPFVTGTESPTLAPPPDDDPFWK